MTQAKAQTVISALIAAGYSVRARLELNEWIVEANGNQISVNQVADFATTQGIIGTVTEARFI
jgi:hypothetical protein